MGAWDTTIKGNDTFQDVYTSFLDRYAKGEDVKHISVEIRDEFAAAFSDMDDAHPALFALALAQWETCSMDPAVHEEVRMIIETGKDLEIWRSYGADDKTLKQRNSALRKLLQRLSTKRERPRSRRRKFEFKFVESVRVTRPDGECVFTIGEEYVNGKYIHTSGGMRWASGIGAGVLYYEAKGRGVAARWLSNETLEVTYEKDISFKVGRTDLYARGDKVKVIYKLVKKH